MAGNFAAGNLSRSRLFAFNSHDFKSPLHRVTRSNDETQGKGRWNDANIFSIIPAVSARRNSSSSSSSSHHLSLSFLLFHALRNQPSSPPPHTNASLPAYFLFRFPRSYPAGDGITGPRVLLTFK